MSGTVSKKPKKPDYVRVGIWHRSQGKWVNFLDLDFFELRPGKKLSGSKTFLALPQTGAHWSSPGQTVEGPNGDIVCDFQKFFYRDHLPYNNHSAKIVLTYLMDANGWKIAHYYLSNQYYGDHLRWRYES